MRYGRHWHSTFGVGLLERGAQRSASGRGQVDAYAGDVITTNPGEVHDGAPFGGATRSWRILYADPDFVGSIPGDGSPVKEFSSPVIRDPAVGKALRRLLDRLQTRATMPSRGGAELLACDEALVDTFALLRGDHTTEPLARAVPDEVKRVRDRLADELQCPPSLTDLAAMVNLSKFQLLRRFERIYGVPPYRWLLLQRAEYARCRIRQGVDLAQAAACAGFADQSHMTRAFLRHFGFTPGAWRNATRAQRRILQ